MEAAATPFLIKDRREFKFFFDFIRTVFWLKNFKDNEIVVVYKGLVVVEGMNNFLVDSPQPVFF